MPSCWSLVVTTETEIIWIHFMGYMYNYSKVTSLRFCVKYRKTVSCWSSCYLCLYFLRLPIDGCIGRRFFHSPAHIHLLKEMKRRLTEVADFHHAASKALRVPAEGSEGLPVSPAGTTAYLTSPELHAELVRWHVVVYSFTLLFAAQVLCWSSYLCYKLLNCYVFLLDWVWQQFWL